MDARANAQRLSRSAAVACLRVLTRNGFRASASVLNPFLFGAESKMKYSENHEKNRKMAFLH